MDEATSEFRQVDSDKFEELVICPGLNYKEMFWPILYKLSDCWNHSQLKVG